MRRKGLYRDVAALMPSVRTGTACGSAPSSPFFACDTLAAQCNGYVSIRWSSGSGEGVHSSGDGAKVVPRAQRKVKEIPVIRYAWWRLTLVGWLWGVPPVIEFHEDKWGFRK